MGLQTPNEFTLSPYKCHICGNDIREDQHAIEHLGQGELYSSKASPLNARMGGSVVLWFHPECATVMALRLAHDVMKIKNVKDQPARVVDELQAISKINQVRTPTCHT